MQQVVHLRPDDDIASIRAQIDRAELSHILLVVPRNCLALQSERGMRMLRRAADDAAAQIALVARDEQVREYAELLGLPVFNSITQAQRTRWRMQSREPDEVQVALNPPPPESVSRAVISPIDLVKRWWGAGAVILVASLFLCVAATLFVPAANVRLVPSSIALSLKSDALADRTMTAVSSQLRAIPAVQLTHEISGTAQLKTTTLKSLPDVRSTGSVVFTNQTSVQVDVPPGTVVVTSAGVPIRFTTVATTTVPAGVNSRADAQIVAVDPGTAGNVKALAINTIEGSLNRQLRVINLQPTASGSLRPTRVVSEDDKKKLETQLLAQLKQKGTTVLTDDLHAGQFLVPDSVLIDTDTEVYDHSVDEPAEILNLHITATAYALAVDQADLDLLASALLEKQLPEGYQLLPNGVTSTALKGGKYDGAMVRMPFSVVAYATPQIDTAKV
ncbi:MAG: baseplate J/gp47 family protein, partial [Chloroflexi bacterium]|nr:baseplate J/gp47 family protein [Chloroflexota bacterium]